MIIVGIAGNAGSGKGMAAEYLVRTLGFQEIAFADVMKRHVSELLNLSDQAIWGPSEERSQPTGYERSDGQVLTARHALQTLGDWGRGCCEDVYVRYVLETIKLAEKKWLRYDRRYGLVRASGGPVVRAGWVISDVRFPNEARGILGAGGMIVLIARRAAGGALGDGERAHVSEASVASVVAMADVRIENDATPEDMCLELRRAVLGRFPRLVDG